MKTKVLLLLLAVSLLALAAWVVHVQNPAQADEIPEKYRATVHKGLEYLLKNQSKDGHWEGDGGKHPVAMTGLAGLALIMEKDTSRSQGIGVTVPKLKYLDKTRKAADWLTDKSQGRDGLIFSEHPSETARYMEGHGLATLFLAGAYQCETDEARRKKLMEVLNRAVKYIVKAQSSQGGWYHTSKVEGHDFDTISTTVMQIQALQAAENAGVPVPGAALSDAQHYVRQFLKVALEKNKEQAKPGQSHTPLAEIAGALACRGVHLPVRTNREGEVSTKALQEAVPDLPVGRDVKFGRDELTHYYYAQALFNVGGGVWTTYRTAMFDHLQISQNKDGSWPAGDRISVGPVYATALWCTVLQLDKRSHPVAPPQIQVITVTRNLGPQPAPRFATRTVGEMEARARS